MKVLKNALLEEINCPECESLLECSQKDIQKQVAIKKGRMYEAFNFEIKKTHLSTTPSYRLNYRNDEKPTGYDSVHLIESVDIKFIAKKDIYWTCVSCPVCGHTIIMNATSKMLGDNITILSREVYQVKDHTSTCLLAMNSFSQSGEFKIREI